MTPPNNGNTQSELTNGKIHDQKFWAVVIGINGYTTSPLRGCVSDAEMVVNFLTDHLLVPKDNIQLLLGTESTYSMPDNKSLPTRNNIVNAILGLSTDPKIERDDNIIIYFAGHGTTYNCADIFKDTAGQLGTIDALCPIDRGLQRTPSTETAHTNGDKSSKTSDPPVPDISDREINTILGEIARTKGNHITFILDCCHSAGITRGPEEEKPKGRVRAISPLSSISDMFDVGDETLKHIAGYQSIKAERWKPDMYSHVVLAACNAYERAREGEGDIKPNGFFTQALIPAFKSAHLNNKSMTYYELLKALPENRAQHPVIAGTHRHSRLWFQE